MIVNVLLLSFNLLKYFSTVLSFYKNESTLYYFISRVLYIVFAFIFKYALLKH